MLIRKLQAVPISLPSQKKSDTNSALPCLFFFCVIYQAPFRQRSTILLTITRDWIPQQKIQKTIIYLIYFWNNLQDDKKYYYYRRDNSLLFIYYLFSYFLIDIHQHYIHFFCFLVVGLAWFNTFHLFKKCTHFYCWKNHLK